MAIEIDIPKLGKVVIEGAAEQATLEELLAEMRSSKNKKMSPEEKKQADNLKKVNEGLKNQQANIEDSITESKKEQAARGKFTNGLAGTLKVVGSLGTEIFRGMGSVASAGLNQFAKLLKNYDRMAEAPIQAGAEMLQFVMDTMQYISSLGLSVASGALQATVGWVPLVGDGLARVVAKFEGIGQSIIEQVGKIAAFVNEVLAAEFQKRVDTLNMYAAGFIGLAGGLSDVASLAGGAALPIKTFGEAVSKARPYLTQMGLAGGDAAKLISKAMGALATNTGKGGRALRDEMFAMGISFADQGAMMAQYMAQLRSLGKDITQVPMSQLAQGTAEYAKHLRVLSDLTGQDASALMASARAEAQRGALMDALTANQARAFQDSFAIFSQLPDQQGAKLQSALAQLLAGGVVTDPIIAGNAIIMDMLQKTAGQVSQGNINMVTATQTNLADAASAYRAAGESVTDFAALMNPNTGAVAQGMAQFGNALRQYRYEAGAAQAALKQTESMAQASGEWVGITETMMGFQMTMEGITGSALPMYTDAMMWAAGVTLDVVKDGITYVKSAVEAGTDATKQLAAISSLLADLLNSPDTPSGVVGTFVGKLDEGLGRIATTFTDMIPDIDVKSLVTGSANGNVLEGPTTGYPAVLHGTEAVVPLPDGRSIPVTVQQEVSTTGLPAAEVTKPSTAMSDSTAMNTLTAAVNAQTSQISELVSLMQRNNNLTSGILQATV